MVIEPRYFTNQLADALIPAEGNRNRNDKASSCSRCGVIEPIMLNRIQNRRYMVYEQIKRVTEIR